MKAPVPIDEGSRLSILHGYSILDTPPEAAFDLLTSLAARIFNTPVVLLSLVDENRQWFKSCYGIKSVSHTDRDSSFCAHAILSNKPLIIPDARDDPRFSDNPLVTGAPGIRFYAGAPLIALEGQRLGTLCLIDTVPRDRLDSEQIRTLEDMAAMAVEELELRRLTRKLTETEALLTQSNRDLDQQRRSAEEGSRLKTRFLANMSHELRTPLNGIIGFSELLADGRAGVLDDRQQRFLNNILLSSRHLLRLINDLLDLGKIEAGKLDLKPEFARADDLIHEVLESLRPLSDLKHITFSAEIGPECDLYTDPARFKQIVYNYFSNALKFTPEHGSVVVRFLSEGQDFIRVEVIDNGMGIAEQDLHRLFQDFEQLESGPAKKYAGTGLGLALVKKLVEQQGGRVEVESTEGKGSRFSAVVPRNLPG
jgi:signal transduction histidine kinase